MPWPFRRRKTSQTVPLTLAAAAEEALVQEPVQIYAPPVERKIHPDLNALAAQFENDVPDPRRTPRKTLVTAEPPTAGPSSDIPFISLSPARPRQRRQSQTQDSPPPPSSSPRVPLSPPQETTRPARPLEGLPESTTSLSSASESMSNPRTETSAHDTPGSPRSSTNSPSETRARRILTRLTTFGLRNSPSTSTTNPPSAWSTFGRRTVRSSSSIPHLTDFGGDSSRSHSDSRHASRATSPSQSQSQHGTRPETPASAFHQAHSPHADPNTSTPYSTFASSSSATPPSSGFTFGSHGLGRLADTSPPPPLPPLDHPAFQDASDSRHGTDTSIQVTDTNNAREGQVRQPRASASLPSMSRPKAQDIFNSPASQPRASTSRSRTATLGGSTRRRRRRERTASNNESIESQSQRESYRSVFGNKARVGNVPHLQFGFRILASSFHLCFFLSLFLVVILLILTLISVFHPHCSFQTRAHQQLDWDWDRLLPCRAFFPVSTLFLPDIRLDATWD